MPVHEWTRVEAAVFHDFHHSWIYEILRALSSGLLPEDHYALADQQAAGFGSDILAVRHVSGDRIVAVIEVISPGNKSNQRAFNALIDKAFELLECRIHLLILDLFPPSKRDPQGIHAVLWKDIADEPFTLPADKPLALMAYESALTTTAYIEPVAVGDRLIDMPLFLEPGGYVLVPLEQTYQAAFAAMPRRWQPVLEIPPR
jgi:hypothetical protein